MINSFYQRSSNGQSKLIQRLRTFMIHQSIVWHLCVMYFRAAQSQANLQTQMQTQKQLISQQLSLQLLCKKIVEKIEATGMILPLVTRTSYKGGLSIPTSSVKPTASWVAEGASSDRQKRQQAQLLFNYYKLRCSISVSLEADTTALNNFESTFVQQRC